MAITLSNTVASCKEPQMRDLLEPGIPSHPGLVHLMPGQPPMVQRRPSRYGAGGGRQRRPTARALALLCADTSASKAPARQPL